MLYIVGTPIGNLQDLSQRQAETIAQSEIILAEDTRKTQILLSYIKETWPAVIHPEQRIISYYKEREFEKLPQIIDFLKEGKTVALLSDAGMPLVSDPGYLLVKTVVKQRIPMTVIPGPNAAVSAIILSGFKPEPYMYLGFLPKKENEVKKILQKCMEIKKIIPDTTFVAYESPERINKTLEIMNEMIPDISVAVCREMTKKFEEVVRGKAKDLINHTYKGEITIVFT